MWLIAQFSHEETIEAIPSTWFFENKTSCLWPPFESNVKIQMAISKQITPEKHWRTYGISRIFAEAETYAIALEKLDITRYNSDVDEVFAEKHDRNKRSDTHKIKISSSDENEITENNKIKIKNFPLAPLDKAFDFQSIQTDKSNENPKGLYNSNEKNEEIDDLHRAPSTVDDSFNYIGNSEVWWIVKFVANGSIKIVPASWMTEDRKYSYYHPYTDQNRTVQAVIRQENPGENWTLFELSNIFESAETYALAMKKCAELLEERISYPKERNISSNLELESNNVMATVQRRQLDLGTKNSNFKKSKVLPLCEIQNMSTDEKLLYNLEMSHEILRNQAEFKVKYEHGSSLLPSTEEPQDFWQIRTIFPFSNVDKFVKFNEDFKNKDTFIKVKRFLGSIGGRDGHKGVRRMLSAILTDEVAVHYSFCDLRTKNSFQNHRVWEIILDVAIRRFDHFTSHFAESAAKDWLKQATRRIQRNAGKTEKKKKSKNHIQGVSRESRNKSKKDEEDGDSDAADVESNC